MPQIDRTPRLPARERRAISGLGSDFVPYSNAIMDVDIGAFNFTTTGLGTFGNLDVDTLNFNGNVISDSTGAISFSNENLTTTGTLTAADLTLTTPVNVYNLSHDSFADFVADEHIAHTGVSISAGTGLTGGGNIAASRTISLSHLGIQSLTDPGADRLLFWDETTNAIVWLTVSTGLQISTTNLSTKDSEIDHDSLSNFAANEHIDWTNTNENLTTTDMVQASNMRVYTDADEDIEFAFYESTTKIGSLIWRGSLANNLEYFGFLNTAATGGLRFYGNVGVVQFLARDTSGASMTWWSKIADNTDTQRMELTNKVNVAELILTTTNLKISGNTTKIYLGSGDEMELYHDGTDSWVYSNSGDLKLSTTDGHIILNSPKTTTGDPPGVEGKIYWNTVDNVIKMYADGAWRTLASW